ncbi:MAG: SdpA family antimicrobial peptide system protein [Labilithrix sp.]|nr:SdpA family antimicrobial peptide system protein [Labilithrix sp.]
MSDADARLGGKALGLGLLATALVAVTVHGSMPANAIDSNLDRDLQTTAWAPESWRFFTRNPQEEETTPYAMQSDGAWSSAASPGGSPRYLFGVDRAGRAQGVELGRLLDGIPKGSFRACDDDESPELCLSKTTKVVRLDNEMPRPSLCGQIGIVTKRPVPWAWARSGRTIHMPARVLRLDVKC